MPTCTEAPLISDICALPVFEIDISVFLATERYELHIADANEAIKADSAEDQNQFLDEVFWQTLYPVLNKQISRLVRGAKMPGWKRQEQDIIEDIVQATIEKMLRKLSQGGEIIQSLYAWSSTVARNCFLDQRRYELRRLHFSYDDAETEENQQFWQNLLIDSTQDIETQLYEASVLAASVSVIAGFPPKRRKAILTDLANNSSFEGEPTPLQQAFLDAGIRLQDYQCASSPDRGERGRQSALCSLAYKDVSQAGILENCG